MDRRPFGRHDRPRPLVRNSRLRYRAGTLHIDLRRRRTSCSPMHHSSSYGRHCPPCSPRRLLQYTVLVLLLRDRYCPVQTLQRNRHLPCHLGRSSQPFHRLLIPHIDCPLSKESFPKKLLADGLTVTIGDTLRPHINFGIHGLWLWIILATGREEQDHKGICAE